MVTVSLIGIPFDAQSSYLRGAAQGPSATFEALVCDSANLWTETGYDMTALADSYRSEQLVNQPSDYARLRFIGEQAGSADSRPIFVGGDHSITYPLVSGLRQAVGDFAILHFDAHPDCYDVFEGNPFSHASPFARIMDDKLCTRLVSVGIRTAHGHQRDQRERYGIEWLEMKDHDTWPELKFDTPVYVSIDLDALDPAFAPGVSHHEPGGMSTRKLLDFLHKLDVPVIGGDVVELNPLRDQNGVTGMVAAKIIRELAGVMVRNG